MHGRKLDHYKDSPNRLEMPSHRASILCRLKSSGSVSGRSGPRSSFPKLIESRHDKDTTNNVFEKTGGDGVITWLNPGMTPLAALVTATEILRGSTGKALAINGKDGFLL
jgi:hypothetical protein